MKTTVYNILKNLRETGQLAWLEAAGLLPLCYRHWLAWHDYFATLNHGRNAHAEELTIAYFTAYYREYGGVHREYGIRKSTGKTQAGNTPLPQ